MKKDRNRSIDMLKTLLVVGMILGHCIQLIGEPLRITTAFSTLINLITFPAFLFCFGYAVSIAYLGKNREIIGKKLLMNSLQLLIVFYLSGISYEIFVMKDFSFYNLIKILMLWKIPGYSEFLVSFFILNILTLIFFNQIQRIINRKRYLIIILICSLLFTFIPYDYIFINQLGLLIGSTKFACFPVAQYIGYYLLGMYFQRNKIQFNLTFLMVSIVCSSLLLGYIVITKDIPSRFPPSIWWVIGSAGFIYVYYLVCIYIVKKIKNTNLLYFIGENTLYFLLGSNIILFFLKGVLNIELNLLLNSIMAISIILICYFLIKLFYKINLNFKKIYGIRSKAVIRKY